MKFVWYGIAGLLSAVIAFFAWAWWNKKPTPQQPPATVSAPAKPGTPENAPAGNTGPDEKAVPAGPAPVQPEPKPALPGNPQAEPEKTSPVPESIRTTPEKAPPAEKKPAVTARVSKAARPGQAASRDKDKPLTGTKNGPDQKRPVTAGDAAEKGRENRATGGTEIPENMDKSLSEGKTIPEVKAPVRTEEKPEVKSEPRATEKSMPESPDKAAGDASRSGAAPAQSAASPEASKAMKSAPSKPAEEAAPARETETGAKAAPPAPEKPVHAPGNQPSSAGNPARTATETVIAGAPVTKPAGAPALSRPSLPDRGDTAMARRPEPVARAAKEAQPELSTMEKAAGTGNGSGTRAAESAPPPGAAERKKTAITPPPPAPETSGDRPATGKVTEKADEIPARKTVAATTRAKSAPDKPVANGNALAHNFVPPSFDLVRVERDGSAVIAGRAMPGSTVSIWANGNVLIGKALVGKRGDWVIISDVPLPAGNSSLTMKMVLPDGNMTVTSPQIVAISRPRPRPEKVAETAPASGSAKNAPDTGPAGDGGAGKREPPDEPLVVVSEQGKASKILQAPKSVIDFGERLVFHTVDYDDSGQIVISGKAGKNTILRAYLDNDFIGETRADKDGQWSLRAQRHVAPGLYRLRVDQLNAAGKVMSRVEVPFERAAPEAIAKARKNGEVIIQPGDNLWNISRAFYGTGMQYTVIYEANKNKIRDPDRIYPGQIFATPDANPEEHQAEREAYRKYMLKKRRRR